MPRVAENNIVLLGQKVGASKCPPRRRSVACPRSTSRRPGLSGLPRVDAYSASAVNNNRADGNQGTRSLL